MEEDSYEIEKETFYTEAVKYWDKIPPTVDGMLGGFGFTSQTDIQGSKAFLNCLFKVCEENNNFHFNTIGLLFIQHLFVTISVIEPS